MIMMIMMIFVIYVFIVVCCHYHFLLLSFFGLSSELLYRHFFFHLTKEVAGIGGSRCEVSSPREEDSSHARHRPLRLLSGSTRTPGCERSTLGG